MKFLIYIAFLFIAELAFASESDVLDLGDNDFDTVIKENPTTLVMFYAPWCGRFCVHHSYLR